MGDAERKGRAHLSWKLDGQDDEMRQKYPTFLPLEDLAGTSRLPAARLPAPQTVRIGLVFVFVCSQDARIVSITGRKISMEGYV